MTTVNTSADYLSIILNNTPLLDVRAPVEYLKGTVNNACNIPLMTDDERTLVGTCYKEQGQEAAIELGRKLVTPEHQANRTKEWLAFIQRHPNGYLFCFRGGLRSRITQQWIKENQVDYPFIEGGYKALRRFLIDELEQSIHQIQFILISGKTGCGKTRLLKKLPNTVDLEGLANHRGSSFGAATAAQPSQIDFENKLSSEFLKHRYFHQSSVFLEDEGRLIGSLSLPINLKEKMKTLSRIELETPLEKRIQFAIEDYIIDLLNAYQKKHPAEEAFSLLAQRHKQSLVKIQKRLGFERHTQAQSLLENALEKHQRDNDLSGYYPFIELLLLHYYDPMYQYQLSKREGKCLFSGSESDIIEFVQTHNL